MGKAIRAVNTVILNFVIDSLVKTDGVGGGRREKKSGRQEEMQGQRGRGR